MRRISIAKSVFTQMKNTLINVSMGMIIRCTVLKCFVWSTMLYGCETWTLSKRMKERLEAAEMWFLRRMMRVPWKAIVSNERILEMAGVRRALSGEVRSNQAA